MRRAGHRPGRGWEEAAGDGSSEVLFVHHGRLGCYRSARVAEPLHRGCAGSPFSFGDFVITLETAIRKEGQDHRIECELELIALSSSFSGGE